MNYQKILIICLMLNSMLFGDERQNFQKWVEAGNTWYERWMNIANQSASMTPLERIETLGGGLGVASNHPMTVEQTEVYNKIQKILLATPGHAEYYGARILQEYQPFKSSVIERNDNYGWSNYTSSLHYNFPLLAQLPSSETVRVMGDMLSEEWEVPGQDKKHEYTPSLAFFTLARMNELPLVKKPPYPQNGTDEESQIALAAWQHWYAQIKEGRRTFQFLGDPKIYSLQGPVREALDPDAPRALKRDASHADDVRSSSSPKSSRFWLLGSAIVALLLLGVGWLRMKPG